MGDTACATCLNRYPAKSGCPACGGTGQARHGMPESRAVGHERQGISYPNPVGHERQGVSEPPEHYEGMKVRVEGVDEIAPAPGEFEEKLP